LESADTLISQGALERQANHIAVADSFEKEALSILGSLLRDNSESGVRPALGVIHFRYAEDVSALGHPEDAARQFLAAAAAPGADSVLATRAHLRAAQSFDLAGKRHEALAEYRIVLSRPNTGDSLGQARRGLKEPYRAK
jgi:hypothetical protein